MKAEDIDWAALQLWCVEGIGTVRLQQLVETFGSAERAIAAGSEQCAGAIGAGGLARRFARNWPVLRHRAALQATLSDKRIAVFQLGRPGYPERLADLGEPAFVFVRGSASALRAPLAAVVGTRSVRADGIRLTRRVTQWCGSRGWGIVSGGARGVDTEAHRSALELGVPTVVVLPAGLEHLTPRSNRTLYEAICASGGCLLTEYPLSQIPKPRLFARRNRLISGLAGLVIVVRAPRTSGALITADWAKRQGRKLFAVPGSPVDPTAMGCLDALADGANLLRSAHDLPWSPGRERTMEAEGRVEKAAASLTEGEQAIVSALKDGACRAENLVFRVDARPQVMMMHLTQLLVKGVVEQIETGLYRLVG